MEEKEEAPDLELKQEEVCDENYNYHKELSSQTLKQQELVQQNRSIQTSKQEELVEQQNRSIQVTCNVY